MSARPGITDDAAQDSSPAAAPVELEEVPHDAGDPVNAALDQFDAPPLPQRLRQFAREQVELGDDALQRVVDLVRDARREAPRHGQRLHALELRGLPLFDRLLLRLAQVGNVGERHDISRQGFSATGTAEMLTSRFRFSPVSVRTDVSASKNSFPAASAATALMAASRVSS